MFWSRVLSAVYHSHFGPPQVPDAHVGCSKADTSLHGEALGDFRDDSASYKDSPPLPSRSSIPRRFSSSACTLPDCLS